MKKASHWILIVIGLGWIATVSFGYFRANATKDWPSVEGKVLSVGAKKAWFSFFRETHGPDGGKEPKFKTPITYGYIVDGDNYIGKYFRINSVGKKVYLSGSRGWLRRFKKVRPREAITVYYDSAEPRRALLETGYRAKSPIFYLSIGFAITGFGIVQIFQRT